MVEGARTAEKIAAVREERELAKKRWQSLVEQATVPIPQHLSGNHPRPPTVRSIERVMSA